MLTLGNRSSNSKQKQYSSSLLISFLFLIIIIATLITFLQSWSSSFLHSSSPSHSQSKSKSLNAHSPYSTKTLFQEHTVYENLSHAWDGLWDDLLPGNGGFILREADDGEEREGKAIEEGGKKKHKFGITMFHSLHCLGIMRGGVQELFREMEELQKGKGMEMDEDERVLGRRAGTGTGHNFGHKEHGDPLHWLHCFDYLRQTILCHADGTLEPPVIDSRGKENVDGMMERQCRDPGELWRASVESFEEGA